MVCLFCLRESSYGVGILGESEMAENARNIIAAHFWFDLKEVNSIGVYVCSSCWMKVETFHEFYLMISRIHRISPQNTSVLDQEIFFNSPLISGHEFGGADDSLINLDSDPLKPYASEVETILIQNIPFLDEHDENQIQEIDSADLHEVVRPIQISSSTDETLALVFVEETEGDNKSIVQSIIPTKKSQTWREKWYEKKKMKTNCPICGKKLAYGSLWYHIRSIHENKVPKMKETDQLEYDICGQWIDGSSELITHSTSHIDKELAQVKYYIDDKWYQELLENHKQMAHVEDSTKR